MFGVKKKFPTFAVPKHRRDSGEVAQLVEHRTENPCVGGSSPPFTTMVHYKPLTINLLGALCFSGGHFGGHFSEKIK